MKAIIGCKNSIERVKAFVDEFIRSSHVEALTSDRDCDFINEPERAERCHDAAEFGADGKTHSEVIQDWRDAFSIYMHERAHGGSDSFNRGDRFSAAVSKYFDEVEAWHEQHGSLYQEIG